MENNQDSPEIKYAAYAYLTVILISAVSVIFPLLFLLLVLLPVPFMIVFHNISRKSYLLLVAITIMSFLFLFGIYYGLILGAYLCVFGTLYGYFSLKRFSALQVVKNGSIGMVLFFTLLFVLVEFYAGISPLNELEAIFEETVKTQVEYLKEIDAPSAQVEEIENLPTIYSEYVVPLIPGILVILGTVFSFIQYVAGMKFFQKTGREQLESFPPFKWWKLPGYFAFIFILTFLVVLFAGDDSIWSMFALNLFYILTYALLIQGAALIYWFLRERKINKFLSVFGIIILLLVPPFSFVILFAGVFDQGFNFRKI